MIKFLYILITISFVTSCSVYNDVQITKDKTVDFDQYQTYAWLPEKGSSSESEYSSDFIRQKTKNYFGHCMSERQMEADTINPQLLLQIEWLSHAREVVVPAVPDYPNYYDADYYNAPTIYLYRGRISGNPNWKKEYPQKKIVNYAHGGAKLMVIDRLTNQKIWEGVAQGDLYDPKIMFEDLHPAIHKMMKKFPIKLQEEGRVKHH